MTLNSGHYQKKGRGIPSKKNYPELDYNVRILNFFHARIAGDCSVPWWEIPSTKECLTFSYKCQYLRVGQEFKSHDKNLRCVTMGMWKIREMRTRFSTRYLGSNCIPPFVRLKHKKGMVSLKKTWKDYSRFSFS